ncbi:MAG: Uncharacterised protein [Cellulomonadaceae bacterium TMED98]|nr:MAG: Uncharacterised protein [Cellulomonadaceae bacterium TMED98]
MEADPGVGQGEAPAAAPGDSQGLGQRKDDGESEASQKHSHRNGQNNDRI